MSAKIPVIDFSEVTLGSNAWDRARHEVLLAAEGYGCFEAVYPGLSRAQRQEFFTRLAELFALPVETKKKNAYKKLFHGYIGQLPVAPLFEGLGIDHPESVDEIQSFTELMWPEGNPGFSEAIHYFAKKLMGLEEMVRRMIMEGLGVKEYYDDVANSLQPLVRVMNYKAPPDGSALGLLPHHDVNFTTILCQDEIDGLEVMTTDGNYVPLTPSADSLVVVIGDSFMAWSNGRLHSPFHRVTLSRKHERFSAGLFMVPKAGWMIKAPEELIDGDHTLLYKPFEHFGFLKHLYANPMKGARAALKEYAGV